MVRGVKRESREGMRQEQGEISLVCTATHASNPSRSRNNLMVLRFDYMISSHRCSCFRVSSSCSITTGSPSYSRSSTTNRVAASSTRLAGVLLFVHAKNSSKALLKPAAWGSVRLKRAESLIRPAAWWIKPTREVKM